MKFAFAVVVLALICGVSASVLPWGASTWGASPWGVPAWGAPWGAPWGASSWAHGVPALPAAISLTQGPSVLGHGLVSPHAAAVVAAPHAVVPGGSYIAKTRGAVHVAPLPGHINSAASINLEPAPGTW